MAKLALIYGMRLLPEEDLGELGDATVTLKNGKTARVTMHLIEGSKDEIEKTFHQSVEAFFEMYPRFRGVSAGQQTMRLKKVGSSLRSE